MVLVLSRPSRFRVGFPRVGGKLAPACASFDVFLGMHHPLGRFRSIPQERFHIPASVPSSQRLVSREAVGYNIQQISSVPVRVFRKMYIHDRLEGDSLERSSLIGWRIPSF